MVGKLSYYNELFKSLGLLFNKNTVEKSPTEIIASELGGVTDFVSQLSRSLSLQLWTLEHSKRFWSIKSKFEFYCSWLKRSIWAFGARVHLNCSYFNPVIWKKWRKYPQKEWKLSVRCVAMAIGIVSVDYCSKCECFFWFFVVVVVLFCFVAKLSS